MIFVTFYYTSFHNSVFPSDVVESVAVVVAGGVGDDGEGRPTKRKQ